jgi:hypothetical protein
MTGQPEHDEREQDGNTYLINAGPTTKKKALNDSKNAKVESLLRMATRTV